MKGIVIDRKFMLQKYPPQLIHTPMQKITIASTSGNNLDATLITPPGTKPSGKAVLFIHGWMGDQDSQILRALPAAENGYICLTFSLSGHGKSAGSIERLTRRNYLDDVISAYDFLKSQKEVDADNITVVSASFGGYLAALLSHERKARALLLRVPANYPDEGFDTLPQFSYVRNNANAHVWKQSPLKYTETRALQAVHDYPRNIFIVESGRDAVIPHQTVQNYVDAVKDKSKLIYHVQPNADHNLSNENHLHEFIQMLTDWLRQAEA